MKPVLGLLVVLTTAMGREQRIEDTTRMGPVMDWLRGDHPWPELGDDLYTILPGKTRFYDFLAWLKMPGRSLLNVLPGFTSIYDLWAAVYESNRIQCARCLVYRDTFLVLCPILWHHDEATCRDIIDPQYCLPNCPVTNLVTLSELELRRKHFKSGECDESRWPDVKSVAPGLGISGGISSSPVGHCGQCKVLVQNFRSYGTCSTYCEAVGRACTGAWEEEDDTCIPEAEIGCDQTLQSNDAICECGAAEAQPSPPPPPPSPPGACDEASWPDVENGFVCGECKVLVENFNEYGSCTAYCQSVGRECSGAWEELGDTCAEEYEMDCSPRPGQYPSGGDAICECSPPWSNPSPPPTQSPTAGAPCYFPKAGSCHGNDDCVTVGYASSALSCWEGCYSVYGDSLVSIDIDEFNTDGDCYEDRSTGEFMCHCCCQDACGTCYGAGTDSLVVAYGYGELPLSCGASSDEVLSCGPAA